MSPMGFFMCHSKSLLIAKSFGQSGRLRILLFSFVVYSVSWSSFFSLFPFNIIHDDARRRRVTLFRRANIITRAVQRRATGAGGDKVFLFFFFPVEKYFIQPHRTAVVGKAMYIFLDPRGMPARPYVKKSNTACRVEQLELFHLCRSLHVLLYHTIR